MRNLIFKNFGLKLFSVALALLLWLVIKLSLEQGSKPASLLLRSAATVEYLCPVLVLHSSANAQTYKVVPSEVVVRVRGEPLLLQRLRTNDIQAFVKLLDPASSQEVFVVDADVPREVRLVDIQPPYVQVEAVTPK